MLPGIRPPAELRRKPRAGPGPPAQPPDGPAGRKKSRDTTPLSGAAGPQRMPSQGPACAPSSQLGPAPAPLLQSSGNRACFGVQKGEAAEACQLTRWLLQLGSREAQDSPSNPLGCPWAALSKLTSGPLAT